MSEEKTIAEMLVDNGRLTEQCREWERAHTKALADVERLRAMIKDAEEFEILACDNCGLWLFEGCACGVGFQWCDARKAALKETSGEQDEG